jgi:hypothetical protein
MDLVWIVAFVALCACTGALVWACGALLQPATTSRH